MLVRPIITLLTDFGTSDAYVGQMKGAILKQAPECQLVDITHEIPPQDVALAARMLASTWNHFPSGTVHLAVVDPGVGTQRDIVAAHVDGHYFVAPNNGLLGGIVREQSSTGGTGCQNVRVDCDGLLSSRLSNSPSSNTFHGRDIMGPAAGMLAVGIPLEQLGEPFTKQVVELPSPVVRVDPRRVLTEVVAIDHFGNCSLATSAEFERWLATRRQVRARLRGSDESIPIEVCRTYGQQPIGTSVLLVGSQGDLEIAVVNGSAAQKLALTLGDSVEIVE